MHQKILNQLNINKEGIITSPLPLKELLRNSVYYPSSAMDGKAVKLFHKEVQSFIYVDYGFDQEQVDNAIHPNNNRGRYEKSFKGYRVVG